MKAISHEKVEGMIKTFAPLVFIRDVTVGGESANATVSVDDESWLLNEHFSGTSIIQSFFQLAMVLYYQHKPDFDLKTQLFFLGGLKVKYFLPILHKDKVDFQLNTARFASGVLLFEGVCKNKDGKKIATMSGSIVSKPRTTLNKEK